MPTPYTPPCRICGEPMVIVVCWDDNEYRFTCWNHGYQTADWMKWKTFPSELDLALAECAAEKGRPLTDEEIDAFCDGWMIGEEVD